MKKFIAYLFVLIIAFFAISNAYIKYSENKNKNFTSPLPDFLSLGSESQVSTLDIWSPVLSHIIDSLSGDEKPQVSAKSALVYDLTTSRTVYEQNQDLKIPIASLTKIMTAIVALENIKTNDQYIVHGQDLVGEDSMGLTTGEILSLEELLYGLILHSGNDAAEVLASNYPLGRTAFIDAMNKKAVSLGLKNTNFTNPTGLEGDGNQYSTAHDLLVISRYAVANFPLFNKVSATFEHTIQQTLTHKEYMLENETNLISSYPGVKGIKTGYTPEAGLCLVTYLDYKGHVIIAILLNSQNRRQEMKNLLDYSLKIQGITPPKHT